MVDFRVAVYNENDIVGAEVRVEHDGDVDTIQVTDPTVITALQTAVASKADQSTTYTKSELNNVFSTGVYPDTSTTTADVNAKELNGHSSDYFAVDGHDHEGVYAPVSHRSSSSEYGVGTTEYYGHVKIIDGLTQTSYAPGEVLSANQGYELNNRLTSVEGSVRPVITLGRYTPSSGEFDGMGGVGVRISDDESTTQRIGCKITGLPSSINPTQLEIQYMINGTLYTSKNIADLKFNANGESHSIAIGSNISDQYVLVKVVPDSTLGFNGCESIIYMDRV